MPRDDSAAFTRRSLLTASGAALVGAAVVTPAPAADSVPADYRIERGNIHHSVMGWCFKPIGAEELAKSCKRMGMTAIEGVSPEHYPMLREMGLNVSLVSSHGFKEGMCDPQLHEKCVKILRERIDLAAEAGYKRVITFTGMRVAGQTNDQMTSNCIAGWKKVVGHAEKQGVTLCLEHLNSRDDSHPMKGHPGYFGDDVDHCVAMIKAVGSPNLKLLFDVYHVQIMNGDVIRRIGQYHEYIGHYHTAGNPGRGELDETQEINYPAVMRAILKTGYDGYVAHEFIPTWKDKLAALRHGVRVCDV